MPAAHYMHPEFGLLCPTRRLRHKLRIGFACAILALIVGAVLRAANIPPSAYPANALTAAGREESAGISSDAGQAPSAALATRASLPAVAESRTVKSACEQDSALHRTWAYLEGKCVAGKARRPRTVRVETDRPAIAAVAIGRIVAPERTGEPVSSAASMPAGPQGDPLKSALAAPAEVAAVAEPPPRPAAASKKPQKTACSHQRRREPTGTDAVWWREVRADDWGARDYGRGGYAREGAFGLGYGERDYGRSGYAREGAFGFFR